MRRAQVAVLRDSVYKIIGSLPNITPEKMAKAIGLMTDMLYVDNGGTDIIVFDCTDVNNIQLVADFDMSCYITDKIEDFTCCEGTGKESHALHGYGI
jgi:hypothetical protein